MMPWQGKSVKENPTGRVTTKLRLAGRVGPMKQERRKGKEFQGRELLTQGPRTGGGIKQVGVIRGAASPRS